MPSKCYNSPVKHIKTIAKNIQKLRFSRNFPISKLADKAKLSNHTIESILYAKAKDVQVSTLLKIAKALNCKVDDLLK